MIQETPSDGPFRFSRSDRTRKQGLKKGDENDGITISYGQQVDKHQTKGSAWKLYGNNLNLNTAGQPGLCELQVGFFYWFRRKSSKYGTCPTIKKKDWFSRKIYKCGTGPTQ